jgi:hypothetical protein
MRNVAHSQGAMIKTLLACIALSLVTNVYAGGTAVWDPYLWPNGGWRYSDGSTSQYDPNQYHPGAGFGGYHFSNGSTAHWDPNMYNPGAGFGGWRFEDGH